MLAFQYFTADRMSLVSPPSSNGWTIPGTVSRDFRLLVFFMNQFPHASNYNITAISNFFENSRRYSRLKVHHRCQRYRWQMEKIFKLKNFNNFVWAPLGSRVNIYINFSFKFTLKVPKREIFVTELFILSDPIWLGDLRTEPIKPFV